MRIFCIILLMCTNNALYAQSTPDWVLHCRALIRNGDITAAEFLTDSAQQSTQSPLEQVWSFMVRAEIKSKQGKHFEALILYSTVISLIENSHQRDSSLLIAAYSAKSTSAMRSSEYTQGMAAIQKAIALQSLRTGENSIETGWLWFKYAELAWNSPDLNQPELIVEKGLACNRLSARPDGYLEGRLLCVKAGLLADKEKYKQADTIYAQAMSITLSDPVVENRYKAMLHYTIGERYELEDSFAIAETYHRKAYHIRRMLSGITDEETVWSYRSLIGCLLHLGQYETVISMADTFLLRNQYHPDHPESCIHLRYNVQVLGYKFDASYALYQRDQEPDRLQQTIETGKQLVVLFDYQIENLERQLLKNRFLVRNAKYYEQIFHLIYDHQKEHSLDWLFDISERTKSYQISDARWKESAMQKAQIPPHLIKEEHNWRSKINLLEKDIALLKARNAPDHAYQSVYPVLAEYYSQNDALKNRLMSSYPVYREAIIRKNMLSRQTAQQMLTSDQTMIEFFSTETETYIFILNKDQHELHRMALPDTFRQLIMHLQHGLYGYYTESTDDDLYENCAREYADAAYKLYQLLLEPYLQHLGSELIIVPDGLLNYVPFEALLTENPEKPTRFSTHAYLIRKYAVSYSFSATIYHSVHQVDDHPPATKGLLAVAPSFTPDHIPALQRDEFRPLQFNMPEVRAIYAMTSGDTLIGVEASKQSFINMAEHYRIIHLATHGKSNETSGDLSYLVFSNTGNTADYYLFAREIYNLSLKADLVVLSACETNIGELRKGEGVISLARAFTYAGAHSVVTTLWSIDDAKTKVFMEDFYTQIFKGQPKNKAMQQAKLKFLQTHKGESAHPFYWAGYIVTGNIERL